VTLSNTAAYAIRASLLLAQTSSGEVISCRRLAAEGQMPKRFLLHILRKLVEHGLLRSTRGVEGGYVLQRKPEDLALIEVIEAAEGPMTASLPLTDEGTASFAEGLLHQAIDQITADSRRQLASITLADLLPAAIAAG
jgi:Rrf2 family transcriptional regulator, cysteine metabolism repressor